MGKILSRIDEIRKAEGLSIAALEKKLGTSKGVLSKAIANDTDIQLKWLEAFVENFPQYSLDWLIKGEGEMLNQEGNHDDLSLRMKNVELSSYKVIVSNLERKIKVMQHQIDELEQANEDLTRQLLAKDQSIV